MARLTDREFDLLLRLCLSEDDFRPEGLIEKLGLTPEDVRPRTDRNVAAENTDAAGEVQPASAGPPGRAEPSQNAAPHRNAATGESTAKDNPLKAQERRDQADNALIARTSPAGRSSIQTRQAVFPAAAERRNPAEVTVSQEPRRVTGNSVMGVLLAAAVVAACVLAVLLHAQSADGRRVNRPGPDEAAVALPDAEHSTPEVTVRAGALSAAGMVLTGGQPASGTAPANSRSRDSKTDTTQAPADTTATLRLPPPQPPRAGSTPGVIPNPNTDQPAEQEPAPLRRQNGEQPAA